MRIGRYLLAIVLFAYAALALGIALTKLPFCDEGWLASPGLNLLRHGTFETSLIEPAGSWLKSINRYTYWVMPLWLLMLSFWYKIFGFGLTTLRSLSTFWGAIGLCACFVITRKLTGQRWTANLACIILACDTNFLIAGGTGRMDMMAAMCGFTGLATYLWFRESDFSRAVTLSHWFVAAGIFCHPNGVIAFFSLCFLTLYLDRSQIRWNDVGLAALPYVAGLALWGLYIRNDPHAFLAQFVGNAKPGARGLIFQAPLQALKLEVSARYLDAYSFFDGGVKSLRALTLLLYAAGVGGALLTRSIRRDRYLRAALWLLLISCAGLFLIDGLKRSFYLVYVLPMFSIVTAIWLNALWDRHAQFRILAGLSLGAILGIQIAGAVSLIRSHNRQRLFDPAIAFLQQRRAAGTMMGPSELGFGLWFQAPLVDDFRLGYYSGKRPATIVIDSNYEAFFQSLITHEKPVYDYVQDLRHQYREVFHNDAYLILSSPVAPTPSETNRH